MNKILETNISFLENIKNSAKVNLDEEKVNVYKNTNINPPFRYYKDDNNLNLINRYVPDEVYTKPPTIPAEKPSQTDDDEIGVNVPFLDKFYGYTDYGNFLYQNQTLPKKK